MAYSTKSGSDWHKKCVSLAWVTAQQIADKVNELNANPSTDVVATSIQPVPNANFQTDKDNRCWFAWIWFTEKPVVKVKLPALKGAMSDADIKSVVENVLFGANKQGELNLSGHVPVPA